MRHGDLTQESVDAILSNANSQMIHDEGLAKDILDAGGVQIEQECDQILEKYGMKIPAGNLIVSSGGSMPCKKVFHCVGPFYTDKGFEKPIMLRTLIGNSFRIAS